MYYILYTSMVKVDLRRFLKALSKVVFWQEIVIDSLIVQKIPGSDKKKLLKDLFEGR